MVFWIGCRLWEVVAHGGSTVILFSIQLICSLMMFGLRLATNW